MSGPKRTTIPPKTRYILWARAAGRCEYRGCNHSLIGDLISGNEDPTFGFIAHIVADSPDGPRGDPIRSPQLSSDINNLMLLCADHHKLIDVDKPEEHEEDVLLAMRAAHEKRIRNVGEIDYVRASHVLRYGANIGKNEALVSFQEIAAAMIPDNYPANFRSIDLEMIGSNFRDDEPAYWNLQQTNLQRQFESQIRGRIERQEIRHLSIFALAPQPLLIELGRLLCDIVPMRVHQRHREPTTWRWQSDRPPIDFTVHAPTSLQPTMALKLGLSATITDERITQVLGPHTSIWSLSAQNPHNDILRSPGDLSTFRQLLRQLYDQIKAAHGENCIINIFPALPVAAAVEVGRVWMPKADLPLRIFDQNRSAGGFIPTLDIY